MVDLVYLTCRIHFCGPLSKPGPMRAGMNNSLPNYPTFKEREIVMSIIIFFIFVVRYPIFWQDYCNLDTCTVNFSEREYWEFVNF